MVRRTISLSKAIDEMVSGAAEDQESYSAAAARLIEAGARALKAGKVPAWIGAGRGSGPKDFARRYERYLAAALKARGA